MNTNDNITEKFICLVGAGYWGTNLLRDLNLTGKLGLVCELDLKIISQHKPKYPDLEFISDIDLIKNYSNITAIVIATPATTHYSITKRFLDSGYDVMVEKPLALTYKEGKDLVEIAKKNGKILQVGHLLHYHPAIITIKDMIKSDKIGKIQYIKSNRLNLGKIRKGENVLWSFAPHDISIILSLINESPLYVNCSGFATLNPPIYDTTTTSIHFKNKYAEINVNWLYPYKEQTLVIVGQKGMITFQDSKTSPMLKYHQQPVSYDTYGEIVLNNNNFTEIEFDKTVSPLLQECYQFIKSCKSRINSLTDGNEALNVLGVLELAQKSLETNGTPQYFSSLSKNYWTHETAIIDDGCEIGEGTKIWNNSHIMKSKIGKNCNIGQNVFIGKDVILGDNCKIQNNVNIYSGVIAEDNVFFGPNCTTTNDKTPRAEFPKNGKYINTYIKKGVSIGASVTLVAGITLGKYALIGSGAVVTKNVSDHSVVVGNPAKVIGHADEQGNVTKFKHVP